MDIKKAIRIVNQAPIWEDNLVGEALNELIESSNKQIATDVIVKSGKQMHHPVSYFCICGKQQKDTFKNRKDGCYCERCGNKLRFPDKE